MGEHGGLGPVELQAFALALQSVGRTVAQPLALLSGASWLLIQAAQVATRRR